MALYDCPDCAMPAAATPRGWLESTDGPVEHVFVRCVAGHWFLGPAEMLIVDASGRPPSTKGGPLGDRRRELTG